MYGLKMMEIILFIDAVKGVEYGFYKGYLSGTDVDIFEITGDYPWI